ARGIEGIALARHEALPVEFVEALADALPELSRRLAREGEAEDLPGRDVAVRDEPEHACGHGLGLAAAGSRDDERRAERRFDDGALLRRRPMVAERVGNR